MATEPYVIKSGDYLTALAYARGVPPDSIWSHASNATLKDLRKNPEMLAPGDVVYLPPVKRVWIAAKVGASNAFKAEVPIVDVSVVLQGPDGKPLAGKEVRTEPALPSETDAPLTTDGDGLLKLRVPVLQRQVDVTVVESGALFRVRVGHLDPHDVRSGVFSRLRQLGYVADEAHFMNARAWVKDGGNAPGLDAGSPSSGGHDAALARAVVAFQLDNDLEPTGALDDDLCAKIRDAHGC